MSELSLPEKLIAVHEALAAAKIEHAIGGAMALAYYAEPRATLDIDVNVFCSVDDYAKVAEALAVVGVDTVTDAKELARSEQCRLKLGQTFVDLFFSYDVLHEEMRRGFRRVPFAEVTIPILAPEHLIICKVVFDRPKDWTDIAQMLIVTADVDIDAVSRHLVRILGPDHPNVARFTKLADELAH
jgi:hypothetical protein